jgi:foldase protein PrsA
MNVKKIMVAAMVGVLALSTTAGCVRKRPDAIRATVVAKVGAVNITKGQIDDELAGLIENLKASYGEDFLKVDEARQYYEYYANAALEGMIEEEVLLQKARELNLMPNDAELQKEAEEEMAKLKKEQFGDDEERFQQALEEAGYSYETLKETFKNQIIGKKVYDHVVGDLRVTDEEIAKYYEENKKAFTRGPGAEMAHILVDTEEKAKEIKEKIDAGEAFEDFAAEYNQDATRNTGGSLGFVEFEDERYDQDFMAAAKKLQEGEVSEPVKTQFGYHLIKATEIDMETVVESLGEVSDKIKEYLERLGRDQLFQSTLTQWREDLKVVKYEKRLT